MFFQVSQAGHHKFLQYLVSFVMIFLAIMLGNIPLMLALIMKNGKTITDINELFQSGLDNNLLLVLMIIPFVFGLFATIFCVKRLHGRRVITVVTARPKLDSRRIGLAFALWFALNLIFEFVSYLMSPGDYTFHSPGWSFVILVLVSVVFLSMQIAFEEIIFRGYLLQGLAHLFNNRWMPLILTSTAFGLMHFQNPEVAEYGISKMMVYYIGVGLVLGIITIMDDGLELALGIHAATNIYSATIVSYEGGALQTDALFYSQGEIVDSSIMVFLIISVLFMLLLSRIYKWNDWSRLWKPIIWEEPEPEIVLNDKT